MESLIHAHSLLAMLNIKRSLTSEPGLGPGGGAASEEPTGSRSYRSSSLPETGNRAHWLPQEHPAFHMFPSHRKCIAAVA